MSRRPPPNSINRSVLNNLNDRENLRKIIKSREFNLERQKELKKIIQEHTEKLMKSQKIKATKLKAGRGKNLRGELKINEALKRRYERGERRYEPTQEPRIYGDPAPAGTGGMSDEDRQLKREELAQQLQIEDRKIGLQEGQELASVDYRNRMLELDELKIQNERDMRAEENEIRRLELEGVRENIPFVNVGNEQFFNNLLSGVATEQQRAREHTERIMNELLEHNRRTQGNMGADIIDELFRRGRETGLRPPSEPPSLPPNPAPPSVILAGDREAPSEYPGSEIADRIRGILSEPAEGSVGALTDLQRQLEELEEPIPEENRTEGLVESLIDSNSETHGGLGFGDSISESNLSGLSSGERFHRLVDEAESVWDRSAEGIEQARISQAERDTMPDFLLVDNPLEELDLTQSEVVRLETQAQEEDRSEEGTLIAQELAELRQQQITTDEVNRLENQLQEPADEGAGVGGLVAQAGQAVGGALVGAADIGLRAAGGVVQGAGEAILEQLPALPTAGEVGAAAGRGLVAAGGAALQAGAGLVAGGVEAALGGGGRIEEVIEELPLPGGVTDEGELLEEVGETNLNPGDIRDSQIDYGEFITHHALMIDRKGRPPRDSDITTQYSLINTSNKEHKKIQPGEEVDITSYRTDPNLGDSVGYKGARGVGATGRVNTIKLSALNKSIEKGLLKLRKK